ncbi:MAG TPA: hypothetical protein VGL46_09585 [Pseudonocardiaceae bacterium]|jgi:hypothetical protein
MTARVVDRPLSVAFVFSKGIERTYTLNLDDLPCPALVRDLAQGLVWMAHPHGNVDTKGTSVHYRRAIRQLSRFLHKTGFTGGAGDVPKTRLVEFWLGHRPEVEQMTRLLLRSVDAQTGTLRPEVREYLGGPALREVSRSNSTPLAPYSDAEWRRLRHCCDAITAEAMADQRAALAEAETGQDPRAGGWRPMANRLWLLRRKGPWTAVQVADYLDRPLGTVLCWASAVEPRSRLFPTLRVTLAFRLLLGMTSGIVPDGLDDLALDDVDWAGDGAILLSYVKGRTRRESLNLPADAVRVLRRWLDYSALLREFAPEPARSALWLCSSLGGRRDSLTPRFSADSVQKWVAEQGLLGDDGAALRIHRHRIRTTFEQRRDKSAWTGRTTIDPNHSARVEGDHYLTPSAGPQREALESVIEDAQSDLVRRAGTPLVVAGDDARAAAELPHRIAHLELTDAVVVELVGGQRDVFTAACADSLAGLHGPAGTPCPARPWVCLLCPLAIFAPRHAPNLLRLKAFFAPQFRLMTLPHFMAVFGPYAHRLDSDILPRFSPAVLAAAAAAVGDRDTELPLRPEEITR